MIGTKRKIRHESLGNIIAVFTLHEIYDLAVQIEKNGEKFFREAVKKASNPSLKALFLWLADQEIRHSEWFMRKKASAKTGTDLDEMSGKMLQSILGNQRFSLGDVDLDRIDTLERLLSIAVEFEEDTIIFFQMLSSLLDDDDSRRGIDEIIGEEHHHIQALKEYQEEGKQDLIGIKKKPDGGNN
jgi:rubrerythrin